MLFRKGVLKIYSQQNLQENTHAEVQFKHPCRRSQTKVENHVYLSEVFLFIELLTVIIRGKSPILPPAATPLLSAETTIKDT